MAAARLGHGCALPQPWRAQQRGRAPPARAAKGDVLERRSASAGSPRRPAPGAAGAGAGAARRMRNDARERARSWSLPRQSPGSQHAYGDASHRQSSSSAASLADKGR